VFVRKTLKSSEDSQLSALYLHTTHLSIQHVSCNGGTVFAVKHANKASL